MCIAGLKVDRMTQTIWATFLMGQVGLICKLSYLIVTMFFRKLLTSGKRVNFGSDKCNEIRITGVELAYYLNIQAVSKYVVVKDFIFKESVQGSGSVSCRE